MSPLNSELHQHLKSVLSELDRLSKQIRETADFSESAELVLCLRELVREQVENQYSENTHSTTHAAG